MLDIRLIREHPDTVRSDLRKRGAAEKERQLDDVVRWDKEWRAATSEADGLKKRRNEITRAIAEAKKAKKDSAALQKEAVELPKKIAALDAQAADLEVKVRDGLMRLPNLLH